MDIRINYLRLKNFKGTRDAEYRFNGGNARIDGANGSGKSTVFDAFTWLLFGKDHNDQTTVKFELKTIDPATGEVIPNLEHWVEAELTIDGNKTVIKRTWQEKRERKYAAIVEERKRSIRSADIQFPAGRIDGEKVRQT